MALSTYSDLRAAVASFLHRSDLTTEIQDFIRLAEADMQVRAKLSEWDMSATVVITSGSGILPADFAQARSASYGSQTSTLQYLEPSLFDTYYLANPVGEPLFYTVKGSSLHIAPSTDGSVTLNYAARFTPLSDSATTNSLLTLFPDCYLNGALMHAASWEGDNANLQKYAGLFEKSIANIRKYFIDYKYPLGLQMRVA